jgi:hypothetical protein
MQHAARHMHPHIYLVTEMLLALIVLAKFETRADHIKYNKHATTTTTTSNANWIIHRIL